MLANIRHRILSTLDLQTGKWSQFPQKLLVLPKFVRSVVNRDSNAQTIIFIGNDASKAFSVDVTNNKLEPLKLAEKDLGNHFDAVFYDFNLIIIGKKTAHIIQIVGKSKDKDARRRQLLIETTNEISCGQNDLNMSIAASPQSSFKTKLWVPDVYSVEIDTCKYYTYGTSANPRLTIQDFNGSSSNEVVIDDNTCSNGEKQLFLVNIPFNHSGNPNNWNFSSNQFYNIISLDLLATIDINLVMDCECVIKCGTSWTNGKLLLGQSNKFKFNVPNYSTRVVFETCGTASGDTKINVTAYLGGQTIQVRDGNACNNHESLGINVGLGAGELNPGSIVNVEISETSGAALDAYHLAVRCETAFPTYSPTAPTPMPTLETRMPSKSTISPTPATSNPSKSPTTANPSSSPSRNPTLFPTSMPTQATISPTSKTNSPSKAPSRAPSGNPTSLAPTQPTGVPSTDFPTATSFSPTKKTTNPTQFPTQATTGPTSKTAIPTKLTSSPTQSTKSPSRQTAGPTTQTNSPSSSTKNPSISTRSPTAKTYYPTANTRSPTLKTVSPTKGTVAPTENTVFPTKATSTPTSPTRRPTRPTSSPTGYPTQCFRVVRGVCVHRGGFAQASPESADTEYFGIDTLNPQDKALVYSSLILLIICVLGGMVFVFVCIIAQFRRSRRVIEMEEQGLRTEIDPVTGVEKIAAPIIPKELTEPMLGQTDNYYGGTLEPQLETGY